MSYDRSKAVAYAHRWAHDRNPRYFDFTNIGGDCTNFVSQCIYAGIGQMDYRPDGWYYKSTNNRSPSWTSVEQLYTYLTRVSAARSPYGVPITQDQAQPGDIIQLSFDGIKFGHSLFVVDRSTNGILIATHTDDADYRSLDSYIFEKLRVLKIS